MATASTLPTKDASIAEIVPPFDYGALQPAVAQQTRQAVQTIRNIERRMKLDIIALGRELSLARGVLAHGLFGEWIATECGYTDRTARNYISVYQAFGGKPETVSDLHPSTLYKLAASSTPTTIRNEVLTRLEAGEALGDEEVKTIVAKAKETEKTKAKATGKLNPNAEKSRRRRVDKELREAEDWRQQEAAQKTAADAAVDLLVEHLGNHLAEFHELFRRAAYRFGGTLRDRLDKTRRGSSTSLLPSDA